MFNINGFSSDTVFIFTFLYFDKFSLNFLFNFLTYCCLCSNSLNVISNAFSNAHICPTTGVPLLYKVVLAPPFINGSNTISFLLISPPNPFNP